MAAEAAARRGVAGAALLMALAMAVPPVFGWHVHALHIARELSQRQGGTLTLSNRPEGGLRARLVLPAKS